jgi:hypothetical protein
MELHYIVFTLFLNLIVGAVAYAVTLTVCQFLCHSVRVVSTGPVNVFVSWKLFVPLSRLTYCAYLSHYIVLLVNIGSNRAPGYLSVYNVVSTRPAETK